MRIERILSDKGGDVVTVKPGATVGDAARLLSEKRIGAVIVCDEDEAPAGILSERDIVRELGRSGPACLDRDVASMMTATIQSCAPHDGLDEVLSKMTEGRFRHMPVMSNDRMVGLVSIGDVVKARLGELSMERDALQGMVMGH